MENKFRNLVEELGYEIVSSSDAFVKIKKKDDENIADCVIIFDTATRCVGGGLITLKPISNIDMIAYQYTIYRQWEKDIKRFAHEVGYERI